MRRKEQHLNTTTNRGRSLISTRIQQHQQRKMQDVKKSQLPRSYSSPAKNSEVENKGNVMRSFSSPDSKQVCYRRNSDTTSMISKPECSKSEFDSDLENYELFEESFIDIDAEPDDITFGAYTKNPEIDQPKKVIATLLPGSGIQKITMKPISPRTIQKIQNARQYKRKHQRSKDENKATNFLNFQPLVLKMPSPRAVRSKPEHSLGIEELRRSPSIEVEAIELEKQLDSGEQHLDAEIAMATAEESDNDEFTSKISCRVGAATPGHCRASSFRGPAPTPTRLERPTTDRATATCSRLDMGNVQCCASDRFDENKQPKKPKSKGKNQKPPKNSSEKTNGLSGDKGNGGVHKVVIVAEEASDRPAPDAALAQAPLSAPATQAPLSAPATQEESQAAGTTDENDGPRSESMAAARERFFGQRVTHVSLTQCEVTGVIANTRTFHAAFGPHPANFPK
ncbi:hypothetical protein RR48_14623 [Papilio machaon]|uniref:Uncharacterized protein n=1 Tax=Papilio machaon TaxID=76193 RepID=A0A194QRL7_PAPMA|nr:hypothetical protein RR48_14623 [Papilio machaon]